MFKWDAPIPKTPKQRKRKRCYTVWRPILGKAYAGGKSSMAN